MLHREDSNTPSFSTQGRRNSSARREPAADQDLCSSTAVPAIHGLPSSARRVPLPFACADEFRCRTKNAALCITRRVQEIGSRGVRVMDGKMRGALIPPTKKANALSRVTASQPCTPPHAYACGGVHGWEAVTRDKAFAFFVGGMSAPRIFPSITLTPRDPISCTLRVIQSAAFLVRHRNSSAHAKGRGTRLAEDGNPWIAGTAVDEHRSWSAAGSRRADEFRRPCVLKDGVLLSSRCSKRRSSSPSARQGRGGWIS